MATYLVYCETGHPRITYAVDPGDDKAICPLCTAYGQNRQLQQIVEELKFKVETFINVGLKDREEE